MDLEDLDESENVEDRRDVDELSDRRDLDVRVSNLDRDQYREQLQADMLQPEMGGAGLKRKRPRFVAGGAVPSYEGGGEVDDAADEYAALGAFEDSTSQDVNAALRAVNETLMYGRHKYGLLDKPQQNFEEGGPVEETDWDYLHSQITPQDDSIPFEGPEDPYGGNRVERAFSENIVQPVQQLGRRLLGYLQSTEADPQMSQRAETEVDPEGVLDEDTRKLLAVQLAQQRDGPEASWRVLQDYRKKYDGYRAFAAAALQNQDLPSAARAASQAYPNILDGTSITFQPTEGGVTALIRPRGGEPQQLQLTPEQFNRWLTGDEGQYDMVLARGGPAQLRALLQARSRTAAPGVTAPPSAPQRSTMNRQAQMEQVPREPTPDEEARTVYPWASQGEQRGLLATKLREAGRERESRVEQRVAPAELRAQTSAANAQTRADVQRDVAGIRAQSYDQRTRQVYEAALRRVDAQMQRGQNVDQLGRERNAMRAIVEKLRNNIELTPQERQLHERIIGGAMGGGQQAPAGPAPRGQPQQRQGGTSTARPPGAAFRDQQGRFYDKFGRPL